MRFRFRPERNSWLLRNLGPLIVMGVIAYLIWSNYQIGARLIPTLADLDSRGLPDAERV